MPEGGKRWVVTGAAGFIGFHVAQRLLEAGESVIGIDNLNDYYEVSLKEARLAQLTGHTSFDFRKLDLADRAGMEALFAEGGIGTVIHLGAQAGVRYSMENPWSYVDSNVTGTLNVMEGSRRNGIEHLVFASTSSIYGVNQATPYRVEEGANHPITMYSATKKANEAMAHAYAHLYGLPCTGLRFFTVYGPWGRPDMAPILFAKAIVEGKPIKVFGEGRPYRDFTYIDDIVDGILEVAVHPPRPDPEWDAMHPDPSTARAPYRIFNIGATRKVSLLYFIELLEKAFGKEAKREMLPMQPGDVLETHADVSGLTALTGYAPEVGIEEGVERFAAWFREYYG